MIAEQGRLPNRYTQTILYLPENWQDFDGYLVHPAENRCWRFSGTAALLALHEQLFTEANYPQAAYQLRELRSGSTAQNSEIRSLQVVNIDRSEIPEDYKPTFIINVLYRQNATWQGTVRWVEGGVERSFRSTLELIRLMDSVIETSNVSGSGNAFSSQ